MDTLNKIIAEKTPPLGGRGAKIQAGIVGGAGYTGGEMLRILINHPDVNLAFVHSTSSAGKHVYEVHADLFGDTDLKFAAELAYNIDVLFLCVGHGDAKKFLDANPIPDHIRIIDLSQDFRLSQNAKHKTKSFVYGLPELNRGAIKEANNIANPGCFATCLQLGLLPLASCGLLNNDIHITATTGSTGAGQSLSPTTHFTWRNDNLSVYKAFEHQHLNEIGQSLQQKQKQIKMGEINFIPYRGDFTRGIIASMYIECDKLTEAEVLKLYHFYYEEHPFTHVTHNDINLKQVVNTNKCFIQVKKHGNKIFIVSIIDNLLKGASGQAVQNMNLMFGIKEDAGLKLKATAF
ncbi:N-acetyl-gamma-glutamyl-phosphate reductase [Mucilaginibacter gotjawali]|uniref:N-acetyl-gamma-glutamyl-phosphate reductase n=2 Tax=Mucilaginibacter gotjawali TaxID=1550579 RepID=A0A839SCK1_9SPHI|nr:N-acetyl-gamma-glutamyl-phosphate reductase [Mucilaginibacter gotjawali]MBB3055915.1 N-acetyl-gamma-glutamyl-phosphate reductase [Mucilaginibacter gotjawali]BAU54738.1 N-acetyl-gamma-glutamyl-phosphate reductase [Mucilaginibacter gotjawali]